MARLQFIGETARGLRNDLQAADDGEHGPCVALECLKFDAGYEPACEMDVVLHVAQHRGSVRRHRWRLLQRALHVASGRRG